MWRLHFGVVRGNGLRRESKALSATEAMAEIFVMAFKALKPKQREAVLQKLVADVELSEDLADVLALEARRHQPHTPLRAVLKDLRFARELAS